MMLFLDKFLQFLAYSNKMKAELILKIQYQQFNMYSLIYFLTSQTHHTSS